jgi:hypothetical protein
MKYLPFVALVAATATGVLGLSPEAKAAEGGSGFYLLGQQGPLAGVTPPPGVYFQDDNYFYSGDTSALFDVEGTEVALGVDADVYLNLPTALWVTQHQVLGGNLGLSGTLVIGGPDISANIVAGGPIGSATDSVFTFGDPVLGAFLGWNKGDFHWKTGVTVNVPIGDYRDGAIANVALNHWAADVYAAATWLNPNTGFEMSGVAGFTFNAENPATNYRTGTEFHLEGAIVQHFSPAFEAGLVGYYYEQLTGDSGSGTSPLLGGYKGRVAAVGATIGLNFPIGGLPISTRLKYFHEFDTKNRLEGDTVFFTVSMPLWAPAQ